MKGRILSKRISTPCRKFDILHLNFLLAPFTKKSKLKIKNISATANKTESVDSNNRPN